MHAMARQWLGLGRRLVVGVAALASATVLAACGSTKTTGNPSAAARLSSASQVQPPAATKPTASTGSPAPSSSPAAGPSRALALAADPDGELGYSTRQLTAKAGRVTIAMTNMSPIEHNVTIARGSKVLGATPTFQGGSKSLTLNLKPGTYTFYCSVPGHRAAGMEGTLTVTQ
jgi:plastocyanin